jgi:hypothetical protein
MYVILNKQDEEFIMMKGKKKGKGRSGKGCK